MVGLVAVAYPLFYRKYLLVKGCFVINRCLIGQRRPRKVAAGRVAAAELQVAGEFRASCRRRRLRLAAPICLATRGLAASTD